MSNRWSVTPQIKYSGIPSTFVSAVPEGTGSADGPRPFFQRVGAAAQRVTFAVEVKRVLGGDAVGAAHAAAAWRQVVLVDVSGTHWDKKVASLLNCAGSNLSKKISEALRRLE